MVQSASESGATHGKIQGLYSSELVYRERFEKEFSAGGAVVRPFKEEVERLAGLDLSEADEAEFVAMCLDSNITPTITVFTHLGVERARRAGFKSIKFASYDCGSLPLIERVLHFADEIFVSTGGTKWSHVVSTASFLRDWADSSLSWAMLHAQTIYPAKTNNIALSRMMALARISPRFGLSDHTSPQAEGLAASKLALFFGANVLERHFTVLEKDQTKDGPVSINPSELLELTEFSRMEYQKQCEVVEEILQLFPNSCELGSLEPGDSELTNRDYYMGRVASLFQGKHVPSWLAWPG
jgi:sialic acid synthase SpsE